MCNNVPPACIYAQLPKRERWEYIAGGKLAFAIWDVSRSLGGGIYGGENCHWARTNGVFLARKKKTSPQGRLSLEWACVSVLQAYRLLFVAADDSFDEGLKNARSVKVWKHNTCTVYPISELVRSVFIFRCANFSHTSEVGFLFWYRGLELLTDNRKARRAKYRPTALSPGDIISRCRVCVLVPEILS